MRPITDAAYRCVLTCLLLIRDDPLEWKAREVIGTVGRPASSKCVPDAPQLPPPSRRISIVTRLGRATQGNPLPQCGMIRMPWLVPGAAQLQLGNPGRKVETGLRLQA